ncbi:uncharacterized protein LOC126993727 [Eriocheir sinensis]|uniref:uncharacterized protein LOC126993727 n=1 Tax=Eriocheir sinensis TaxID=95602 RepID=UPI0021C826DB|nr:uncharacterized protein LOC126993727 [Eriocheir sinensis]
MTNYQVLEVMQTTTHVNPPITSNTNIPVITTDINATMIGFHPLTIAKHFKNVVVQESDDDKQLTYYDGHGLVSTHVDSIPDPYVNLTDTVSIDLAETLMLETPFTSSVLPIRNNEDGEDRVAVPRYITNMWTFINDDIHMLLQPPMFAYSDFNSFKDYKNYDFRQSPMDQLFINHQFDKDIIDVDSKTMTGGIITKALDDSGKTQSNLFTNATPFEMREQRERPKSQEREQRERPKSQEREQRERPKSQEREQRERPKSQEREQRERKQRERSSSTQEPKRKTQERDQERQKLEEQAQQERRKLEKQAQQERQKRQKLERQKLEEQEQQKLEEQAQQERQKRQELERQKLEEQAQQERQKRQELERQKLEEQERQKLEEQKRQKLEEQAQQKKKLEELEQQKKRDELEQQKKKLDELEQQKKRDELEQQKKRDELEQQKKRDELEQQKKRDELEQQKKPAIAFLCSIQQRRRWRKLEWL